MLPNDVSLSKLGRFLSVRLSISIVLTSHHSLGEPETAEPTDFVDVDYIDPKDRPLAEFTFLYRTKSM